MKKNKVGRAVKTVGVAGALFCAAMAQAGAQSVEVVSAEDASRPIASISGDWNRDGALDGALLFTSGGGASLFVYFGGQDGSKRTSVLAQDIVWHDEGVFGQQAGLERATGERIVVTSQNSAIGRDRWTDRLTLAYEDGALRVVSYARRGYDTLDPNGRYNCDLDFKAGTGVLNTRPVRAPKGAPLAKDWSMENAPPEVCNVE